MNCTYLELAMLKILVNNAGAIYLPNNKTDGPIIKFIEILIVRLINPDSNDADIFPTKNASK